MGCLSELVLNFITQIQIKVSNTKNKTMSSTTSAGKKSPNIDCEVDNTYNTRKVPAVKVFCFYIVIPKKIFLHTYV